MSGKKIGFHSASMSERGTEIALFDYARYNRELLGHESVIFAKRDAPREPSVVARFEQHFPVVWYDTLEEREREAARLGLTAMYFIKSGERDDQVLRDTPSLIHAVFPVKLTEPHGAVYAFVSPWLAREYSNHTLPHVPHMIDLPPGEADLRDQLAIPRDATVFGCYGGATSFDLRCAREVVAELSASHRGVYFIFMNIPAFCDNEQVRFLPRNTDLAFKRAFINTADAMLHGRSIGESFGLACGEFSVCNKPVFTYAKSPQRSHIEILGERAQLYAGKQSLKRALIEFDRRDAARGDWDCYSAQFSPAAVMKQFDEVFLSGRFDLARLPKPGALDRLALAKHYVVRKLRHHSKKFAR